MRAGHIANIWVPRWVIDRTWTLLRQDGRKGTGLESTVLWGGRRFRDEAVVMSVLYPCGADVELSSGSVRVGADTTAQMGRWLRAEAQRGLVQVHSHPEGWTGHSKTDDDGPIISAEGFVSLVWPNYGTLPVASVRQLGVHRLKSGRWHELEGEEAEQLIRIVESEAMVHVPAA